MREDARHGRYVSDDSSPHSKPNMTSRFGRIVERTTYLDLVLLAGLALSAATLWFRYGAHGHTLKDAANLFDCAYFALVTFTSLGYGEIVPVGFGRVVAMMDVLSGLALTATLIGKVASERQSSILLLLHTSDTQRRISDFSQELADARTHLQALVDKKDAQALGQALESHFALTKAIRNYLIFNSHQAGVVEFGNFTALIGLYDEIRDSFDVLCDLHRTAASAEVMRRSLANMHNLGHIVSRMGKQHHKVRNRDALWRACLRAARIMGPTLPSTAEQTARNRLTDLNKEIAEKVAAAEKWVAIGVHPIQNARVFDAFPTVPRSEWSQGIHKIVANKLGISNSVAASCINELLEAGHLPKVAESSVMAVVTKGAPAPDAGEQPSN